MSFSNKYKRDQLYPFRLWVISVALVAPLLLGMMAISGDSSYFGRSNNFGVIVLFAAFGLLLSVPVFLLSLVLFNILSGKISDFAVKLIITVVGVVGVVIIFYLMDLGKEQKTYTIVYILSILISSIALSIKKEYRS